MHTGQRILDYQTAIRLPDGSDGQILIRTVPLRDTDGAIFGAALILGDVTEVTALRKEVTGRRHLGGIIGKNRLMQQLYRLIEDVASSDASVLIRGESGTGKELVARAVHQASQRVDGPFIQVNCSALSENLLESELFGHVRGAFTGAVTTRRGRFEEARGGTIFLDEIGDVSPVVQVKLLRVLQEKVIERVGDNQPVPVDVRIVSATNRDLEQLLASGTLREDFYYRIKVVSLDIPPLRERREDIPLLTHHFLARLRGLALPDSSDPGPIPPSLASTEAMGQLMRHRWPGNVRELENALEHANVLSRSGTIQPRHLPPEITRANGAPSSLRQVPRHTSAEKQIISAALARTGWNRSRAARQLGIDRTTLWRKIKEYELEPEA
jgi:transcriptional regulator with PAS, ATPase and Fis domain